MFRPQIRRPGIVAPKGSSGEEFAHHRSPTLGRNGQALVPLLAQSLAGIAWEKHSLGLEAEVNPEGATAGGCQLTVLPPEGCVLSRRETEHLFYGCYRCLLCARLWVEHLPG